MAQVTQQQIDTLQQQIDALNNSILGQSTTNLDTKTLSTYSVSLANANTQLKQFQQNNASRLNLSNVTTSLNASTKSLTNLSLAVNKTDNLFNKFFSELGTGFPDVIASFNSLTEVFSNLGSNTAFWNDYQKRINSLGAEFGLSGERLKAFDKSNRDIESTFVGTGKEIKELTDGIQAYYNATKETNQITPDFAKDLGNISKLFDISTTEVGEFLGAFKNLNVSYGQTTKILDDLRYAAEKSALNTKNVVLEFTKNFEKLNTFSFKNGIQGMIEMTKQSAKLKTDMNAILDLADKLDSPENAMELAANLQILGGSFAQLGDFNQLMYDAAVAPEDLAKNIAKAAASMGTFNKETGKLDISFAERLQLKEVSKDLGLGVEDLQKMATQAAKISDIKMSVSLRPLTEDQYDVIAAMSEFKDGKYTVDVAGQTKSITELSDDDIKKLASATKDTMEGRRVAKMTVDQLVINKSEQLKYATPNLLKASALNEPDVIKSMNDTFNLLVNGSNGLVEKLKKGPIQTLENLASSNMEKNMVNIFKSSGEAIKEFTQIVKTNVISLVNAIGDKELTKKVNNMMNHLDDKKEMGDVLLTKKYDGGTILNGPSHMQGGIPFTINRKPGFEAEGGETILTKGVSENPLLLGMASKLNEIAGGKKLTDNQPIIDPVSSTKTVSENPLLKTMSSKLNEIAGNQKPDYKDNVVKHPDTITNQNVNNQNSNLNQYTNNLNEMKFPSARQVEEKMKMVKIMSTTEQENITKLSKNLPSTEPTQGGLASKHQIDVGKLSLAGNISVDGEIKFGEINIKIDGDNSKIDNKELKKSIQESIINQIKIELSKPNTINLHHLAMNQKGSGLNEGGKDNSNWYT